MIIKLSPSELELLVDAVDVNISRLDDIGDSHSDNLIDEYRALYRRLLYYSNL